MDIYGRVAKATTAACVPRPPDAPPR